MKKLGKGEQTRNYIIETARGTFNEKGVNLTLDQLAAEMDTPKGRITNHFSTKEKLILAIMEEYETKLASLRSRLKDLYEARSIHDLVFLLSKAMDLQYEYRCAITFLAVLSPSQSEIKAMVLNGKKMNKASIRNRMANMVKHKLVESRILDESQFELFIFIYLNLLTQWVIHFDLYDKESGYDTMKPLYIRGIMEHAYGPYLTAKGRKQWKALDLEAILLDKNA